MKLHVFNPEHDMALAYNNRNFTAPHAGRTLRKDLGFLPALWADDGDFVLVDDIESALESVRHIKKYTNDVVFVTPGDLHNISLESVGLQVIDAWGWDSAIKDQLLAANPDLSTMLPTESQLDTIRTLSNRKFAAENILPALVDSDSYFIGEAYYCKSMEDVMKILIKYGAIVLKAPWSCSGRGVRYVCNRLDDHTFGWCRNIILRQGAIMAEPYYNKVKDFGMEFSIDSKSCVSYKGLSLFRTDNGAYSGSILATEKDKREMLTKYVSDGILDNLASAVTKLTSTYLSGRYVGAFGLDMMIIRTKDGQLKIHPCVEINMRRTMGHVALAISPSEIEPQGVMRITYSGKYKLRISRTDNNIINNNLI